MKVIDAFWEKRNLGVSTTEIVVENTDNLDSFFECYSKLTETDYMVLKVPSGNSQIVSRCQELGYSFIETAVKLKHSMKDIGIPNRLKRICDECTYELMTPEDIEIMYGEIRNGIFKTDRISVDPFFSTELAAERYCYWIADLIEQGHIPYKVIYKQNVIGFFLNKCMENNVFDGLLAGVYSEYESTGLGYCVQYAGLKSAYNKGGKGYIGHISGNNPAVMRVLISMGFSVIDIEYVFIKHN